MVIDFVEKPNINKAKEFFESGLYTWNSGIFAFKSKVYLEELAKYNMHLHTRFSGCAKPEMNAVDIVKTAEAAGLEMIALTDHNYINKPNAVAQQRYDILREIADMQTEECIIIGSDTIVAKGEEIMGKPKDETDAFRMLSEIAGNVHQVYTGVTLIRTGENPKVITFAEKTDVYLYPMTDEEI